ncbi:MAG: hypothetical protein GF383_06105 [Candidatus Lokiarchaeota archaeon]|nr:hypothetical protein [Candidatus Lokiarchaeota archaeon]MBD3339519.1 hypothetical protein [Candidatus Lokiarchaeota archaeon]
MNSRERVLTSFSFQEPDQVPLFEAWIETVITTAIADGDPYKAREKLGLDCFPVAVGHPKSTNAWRTGTDEWGRIFKNGIYIDGKVKKKEILEEYTPDTEYADAWFSKEQIRFSKKKYGETHAIYYAFHDACLGLSYMSMGLKDFFVAVHRDKEFVNALMERSTEWTIAMIERACATGADFVMVGDDVAFGTGPMMSPKLFKELVIPHYKEIVKVCKVPLIWHSDGDIRSLIPMIIDAGFAGIHSLEPNAHINMGEIKELYGEKIVLAGNLDVSTILTQSDLDLVRKDVERCITQGAPGGGYLFSSSNSLFSGMCLESILEAYRYAKKFSKEYYDQIKK